MKYDLTNSMTDRINFDEMVERVLEEEFLPYVEKENLTTEDALKYFELENIVDDVEEAEARILDIAKKLIIKHFVNAINSISLSENEVIIIFDEGHEIFGIYRDPEQAANDIEKSNTDWWANKPVYEIVTEEYAQDEYPDVEIK